MRRVWLVGFEDRTFAAFSSYRRAAEYADQVDALPHAGEWSGVTVKSAILNHPETGVEDTELNLVLEALSLDNPAD